MWRRLIISGASPMAGSVGEENLLLFRRHHAIEKLPGWV
jgi:hypothetical protein